jgi:hypothetical protein
MKLTDYTISAIGFVCSVVVGIVLLAIGVDDKIAFMIGTILALIVFMVDFEKKIIKNVERHEELLKAVIKGGALVRLDAAKADAYIFSKSKEINCVKNTTFYPLSECDSAITDGMKSVIKTVKSGVHWEEISNHEKREEIISMQLNTQEKARYKYTLLKQNDVNPKPILEFATIIYKDGRKEVIFGWSERFGGPTISACFLSQGHEILDLFDAYFDEAARSATTK